MTTGIKLGLVLGLTLPLTAIAAESFDEWLAQHAPTSERRVAFTESRASALLTERLVSRGFLRYEPPGRLEKHIVEPRPEVQIITAEQVIIKRPDGERREFSLHRAPALVALRQALLGWLNADAQALQEHFQVELEEADGGWRLILQPRDKTLGEELDLLVLEGRGDSARVLTTHLNGGEVIITRFETGG